VIGVDASVEAVHERAIELDEGDEPVGAPGTVGGVVSPGFAPLSPGALSTTKWSKFAVKVLLEVVPS
jgi:hypothetical protein